MSAELGKVLERDWAMDPMAASVMSERIPEDGRKHILGIARSLGVLAAETRDAHRTELKDIISSESEKMWLTLGPCSTDFGIEYEPLHDLRDEVAEAHQTWFVAERLNADKPRTSKGWKGPLNSTDPEERRRAIEIMHEAMVRKIPVLTEVTDPNHLGTIAPYLTGVWIGARDILSGHLRGAVSSVSGMAGAIKNGTDGRDGGLAAVETALLSIGSSTETNDGSGVNWGTIASTADHLGFPTGMLPVGEGHKHVGIIGRGYELPANLTQTERESAAYSHISALCATALANNTVVSLDINHGSPKMFNLGTDEADRPAKVIQHIAKGILNGRITNASRIRGFMCEIGPVKGRTDPNWVIDGHTAERLGEIMLTLTDALKQAK